MPPRKLARFAWLLLFQFVTWHTSLQAQSIPNVPQTKGELLSGPLAPQQGRTAVIAFERGYLITNPESPGSAPGSDLISRAWDISDPRNPRSWNLAGIGPNSAVGAHGYWNEAGLLYGVGRVQGGLLSTNGNGEPELQFVSPPPVTVHWPSSPPPGVGWLGRGLMFQPFQTNMWWSYGATTAPNVLYRGTQLLASWDHIGQTGVIGHPFLVGNILYVASDQTMTGVAAYDISPSLTNPGTPPRLISVLKVAVGGYWPEIWGGDDRLIIVFPNRRDGQVQFVDVTDPASMFLAADRSYGGGGEPQYAQFQDGFAFIDCYKINMRANFTLDLLLDCAGHQIDASQFALPLGNLVATGGYPKSNRSQGLAIWAHQAEPDTQGPTVGFHIPRADQTNYPLAAPISLLIHETLRSETITNGDHFLVRPLSTSGVLGQPVAGRLTYSFDDQLTFTPTAPLLAGTTYEVLLPAGGIEDAAGNGMIEYRFRFSTGSALGAGNGAPSITGLQAASYPITPNVTTTITASASDPENDPLFYRFDFGDGTAQTNWQAEDSVDHTYTIPGHYPVTVQVRDTLGNVVSRRMTITAMTPPNGPRPTQSSSVAFHMTNNLTWSVNPDNDSVTTIDHTHMIREIPLGNGCNPKSVAVDTRGNGWVPCFGTDRIQVVSSSGSIARSIELDYGSAPYGVAISPDGETAFVTHYGKGLLTRYSSSSFAETGRVALGSTPRALAVSGNGQRVLVTRHISSDQSAGQVWDVAATSGGLVVARTIALREDWGSRDTSSAGRGIPNFLSSIAIAPSGEYALITGKLDNARRGLASSGRDLTQENTVRAVVFQIDLATNSEQFTINANGGGTWTTSTRRDVDNSDSPSSILFSPLGDYAFVALQGNNVVAVYDMFMSSAAVQGLKPQTVRLPTGLAPQGLALNGNQQIVAVQDFTSRTVSFLDVSGFLTGLTSNAARTSVRTITNDKLSANELLGKQIFYNASDTGAPNGQNRMSGEGYISCATCHIDGGHDGRTWDFTGRGEGLRNTTDLRGRSGLAHGRVHWSANFDEIQDFESDIRNSFGGAGFMRDSDFVASSDPLGAPKAGRSVELDALAAYVSSLHKTTLPRSPYREPNGSHTAQALQGQALYQSHNCSSCHARPKFTDSASGALHDVGTITSHSGSRLGLTLTGVDTPTLLGVWETAPYLHDGSAPDLASVFRASGGIRIPAESAVRLGSAALCNAHYGGFFRNGGCVALSGAGQGVAFHNVHGGIGGQAKLHVRYGTNGSGARVTVRVNGSATTLSLPRTVNDPGWAITTTAETQMQISLLPGTQNTIEVLSHTREVAIDEIGVANSNVLAATLPHSLVDQLGIADRDALIRYLLELDGSNDDSAIPTTPTATPIPSPNVTPSPHATVSPTPVQNPPQLTPTVTPAGTHTATPTPSPTNTRISTLPPPASKGPTITRFVVTSPRTARPKGALVEGSTLKLPKGHSGFITVKAVVSKATKSVQWAGTRNVLATTDRAAPFTVRILAKAGSVNLNAIPLDQRFKPGQKTGIRFSIVARGRVKRC